MRKSLMGFLIAGIFAGAAGVKAQTSAMATVPMTKVLAIGHLVVDRSAIDGVMPSEVRETVKLYLGGKIDQWYVRQDGKGVVFVMNVNSVDEAHALLEKLPLGVNKMMEFELMPLGPLRPLSILLAEPITAVKP
jgi:hypothetical protein